MVRTAEPAGLRETFAVGGAGSTEPCRTGAAWKEHTSYFRSS
jgi:hypothetical protein